MASGRYSTVTERAVKVAIVATGESLKGVTLDFPDDVTVIAVNSAIKYLPKMNFWFTLDPSPINVEIMRTRKEGVVYYAAVPDDFKPVSDHVKLLKRVTGTGHGRYKTRGRLCNDKGAIHTGNSAWGALQLACHMSPRRVALFGVDGHGGYHYGGVPRNLAMLSDLFTSSIPDLIDRDISVINGSPSSVVDCFRRVTPMEALRWLVR